MTHAALRTELVARTRLLPAGSGSEDPLAALGDEGFAWLHDGAGFATAGVAARVSVDEVERVLAGFAVDDPVRAPGTGAIAVGGLPFDPAADGEMVVPARVVGRSPSGRMWRTEIEPFSPVPVAEPQQPTRFVVSQGMDRERWDDAVRDALAEIDAGSVQKVVLARDVYVSADVPFDVARVVHRLRVEQPGCFVFAGDGLVGASPELLVARDGLEIRSRPLAGTTPLVDDRSLTALAASAKDVHEHRFVVDAIVDELRAHCDGPVLVTGPEVVRLSTLAHLATTISGRLPSGRAARGATGPSALALARALHPTPAVGGTPTPAALTLVDRLEGGGGRGRYAGPVGWVDAAGNGEFALALRSAEIDGPDAVLRAGAGIVAGSEPGAEWAETEAKFAPMLAALVRP